MAGVANTVTALAKKFGYYGLQYGYTALHWILRFFKVQGQKWHKCGAQKKMDKACSALGAEVYSVYKQGEADWANMPSIQQQLKQVEETEAEVFQVNESVEAINNQYLAKKEELKELYAAKRDEVGKENPEEPEL